MALIDPGQGCESIRGANTSLDVQQRRCEQRVVDNLRPTAAEPPSASQGKAGPSVAGCDCSFDVVEESLEYQVMKGLDPLTPDRLVLPDHPTSTVWRRTVAPSASRGCQGFGGPPVAAPLPGLPPARRQCSGDAPFRKHDPGMLRLADANTAETAIDVTEAPEWLPPVDETGPARTSDGRSDDVCTLRRCGPSRGVHDPPAGDELRHDPNQSRVSAPERSLPRVDGP
jgi:hypothetical protein